jgi:serine/threonine protein phosphatase PrpC
VERAGGRFAVDARGRLRVGGRLEVTRALGDLSMKAQGVVARPEVRCASLRGTAKFEIFWGPHGAGGASNAGPAAAGGGANFEFRGGACGACDLTPRPLPRRTLPAAVGAADALVLASDGLFDALSPEEVARRLGDTLRHGDYGPRRLCVDAVAAGSQDNVTAAVAYFG